MKNSSHKISANEINRYMYCPYQWYYNRYYGAKVLNQKYKELGLKKSPNENPFKKGLLFHKEYDRLYRFKKLLQLILTGILILIVIVGVWWYKWR